MEDGTGGARLRKDTPDIVMGDDLEHKDCNRQMRSGHPPSFLPPCLCPVCSLGKQSTPPLLPDTAFLVWLLPGASPNTPSGN